MRVAPTLRENILAAVPGLRVFAIALAGNVDRADDLVQKTLLHAIAHTDSLRGGTNIPASLFRTLRDLYRSEYRDRRGEVEDGDGAYARSPSLPAEQPDRFE